MTKLTDLLKRTVLPKQLKRSFLGNLFLGWYVLQWLVFLTIIISAIALPFAERTAVMTGAIALMYLGVMHLITALLSLFWLKKIGSDIKSKMRKYWLGVATVALCAGLTAIFQEATDSILGILVFASLIASIILALYQFNIQRLMVNINPKHKNTHSTKEHLSQK